MCSHKFVVNGGCPPNLHNTYRVYTLNEIYIYTILKITCTSGLNPKTVFLAEKLIQVFRPLNLNLNKNVPSQQDLVH